MAENDWDPNFDYGSSRRYNTLEEMTAAIDARRKQDLKDAKECFEIQKERIALQASLAKIDSYIRSGMTMDIIKSVVEEECRKHGLCQEGK